MTWFRSDVDLGDNSTRTSAFALEEVAGYIKETHPFSGAICSATLRSGATYQIHASDWERFIIAMQKIPHD